MKQAVIDTLTTRVLTMELAPGQMLDEVAMAAEFGISRTPMREIIQRLAGQGYLTLEEKRGAKVAPMDFPTLRQFFQAAPMIYAAIARLAAENATPADVDRLKDIQHLYRETLASGDARATAMHNHHFHEAIGAIAASDYLMPSLKRLLIDHTRIGQVFYRSHGAADRERIETAAEQHDGMIDAIASHSPARAVELTLEHWALSRHRIEQFVSPDPLTFELQAPTEDLARAV